MKLLPQRFYEEGIELLIKTHTENAINGVSSIFKSAVDKVARIQLKITI